MRFRRILLPTDLSPSGEAATRVGAELAHRLGAALTLLWIVPEEELVAQAAGRIPPCPMDLICEELERELMARFLRVVRPAARQGLRVKTVVRMGTPSEEIVGTARRAGADVIVLAMPGRSALDRMLRRRVVERVLRQADRPVLAVPRPRPRPSRRAGS